MLNPCALTQSQDEKCKGAGIGLRRPYFEHFSNTSNTVSFLEIAPENWIDLGGRDLKILDSIAKRYPLICHGLSLSLGSITPLNESFISKLKSFLTKYNISIYSEHLSYCDDGGYLYDLFPIPFTTEAVQHVAKRIRQVQNQLERKIAIENVSYYCAPFQELSEIEFINAVLAEADCDLLLDVNNVYVNSINQNYDPTNFLQRLDPKRIRYIHIAGHLRRSENLCIDTHGSAVIEPVWQLLREAYQRFGPLPTLLERDFDIPPLETILEETQRITALQAEFAPTSLSLT